MPQAMWWVLIAIQLATSEVFCFGKIMGFFVYVIITKGCSVLINCSTLLVLLGINVYKNSN